MEHDMNMKNICDYCQKCYPQCGATKLDFGVEDDASLFINSCNKYEAFSGVKKAQIEYYTKGMLPEYNYSFWAKPVQKGEVFIVIGKGEILYSCLSEEEANEVYNKYFKAETEGE